MAFIDGSVVNVALPAIQTSFNSVVSEVQWVVNAYTLMLGAFILVGGSAGDLYGRRNVFTAGIVIFTLAAAVCGIAPSIVLLISARTIQGLGGALMIPTSLALINAAYRGPARSKAIGTWAGFTAISTSIGPLAAGWLIDTFSWRPVFFIYLPVALLTLLIVLAKIPRVPVAQRTTGLDWQGALLAAFSLGAITFALVESSNRGVTDPVIILSALTGLVILAIFIIVEKRKANPLVPLGLFRSHTFAGSNLLTLLLYFGLSGAFFFLPFNLVQIQGYSATLTGLSFLPFTLLLTVLSPWAGGLVSRYGPKKPLIIGPSIAGLGFALFALPLQGNSYVTTALIPVSVLGLGMAITVAPLTSTVLGSIDIQRSGIASGINNAISRIAVLLAVSILGLVAVTLFSSSLQQEMRAMDLSPQQQTAVMEERQSLAALVVPDSIQNGDRQSVEIAVDRSFLRSYRVVMLIISGLAFLSAAVAAVSIDERDLQT